MRRRGVGRLLPSDIDPTEIRKRDSATILRLEEEKDKILLPTLSPLHSPLLALRSLATAAHVFVFQGQHDGVGRAGLESDTDGVSRGFTAGFESSLFSQR